MPRPVLEGSPRRLRRRTGVGRNMSHDRRRRGEVFQGVGQQGSRTRKRRGAGTVMCGASCEHHRNHAAAGGESDPRVPRRRRGPKKRQKRAIAEGSVASSAKRTQNKKTAKMANKGPQRTSAGGGQTARIQTKQEFAMSSRDGNVTGTFLAPLCKRTTAGEPGVAT